MSPNGTRPASVFNVQEWDCVHPDRLNLFSKALLTSKIPLLQKNLPTMKLLSNALLLTSKIPLLQNLLSTMRLCSPGSSGIVEQSSSSDFKHTFVAKSFAGRQATSHRVLPFPWANSFRRLHKVQVPQCSSHHLAREYACLSPESSLHVHSSQRKEQMPPPKLVSMASSGLPSISAKKRKWILRQTHSFKIMWTT